MPLSLAAYARSNCACWNNTNGCYRTEIVDMTMEPPRAELGPCLVGEGKPCQYFRQAIYPDKGCPQQIRFTYGVIDRGVKGIESRFCQCGAELRYRERVCEKCRRQRRLESKRQSWRKKFKSA